jgi:hypothetical protein
MSKSGFDTSDSSTFGQIDYTPDQIIEPVKMTVRRFYDSKYEKAVCECADGGAPSARQICFELGKPDNGRNISLVKKILKKYQIKLK